MIDTLGRIFEHNEGAVLNETTLAERQAEIEGMALVKRAVTKPLLKFTRRHEKLADKALDFMARKHGYSYLDSGYEFSAYKRLDDDSVVKIHRRSAGLSESERQNLADNKNLAYQLLTIHFGKSLLDQTVSIDEHILGKYPTVQIKQPFLDFTAADAPFISDQPQVDLVKLEDIVRLYPGADQAFAEFVDRSHDMYASKGLLPDTNGANNVVARPTGEVILLDSTPIRGNIGLEGLILGQLASLKTGLLEVA